MSWESWADGVLDALGAPIDAVNLDTLWAWSSAESGTDVMRWNNPLNTTLAMFSAGNVDANSVGVKIYPSEGVGIRATALTLLNGYYPLIVDHLRRSVPRAQWSDCCGQLGTWGTGCAWINSGYGAAPGGPGEEDMTPAQEAKLDSLTRAVEAIEYALFYGSGTPNADPSTGTQWGAIHGYAALYEARLKAILPPAGEGALTPTQAGLLELIGADVASVKMRIEKDLAP